MAANGNRETPTASFDGDEDFVNTYAYEIFNYDRKLDQEFANIYDASGAYVRSRISFADGTIIED